MLCVSVLHLLEREGVEYLTCVSASWCDCPSSHQLCKHIAFARKMEATRVLAKSEESPEQVPSPPPPPPPPSPPLPDVPTKPGDPDLLQPGQHQWNALQDALEQLGAVQRHDLSPAQLSYLAVGARNLLHVAKHGIHQPALYRLRRNKTRKALAAEKVKERLLERTRRPQRKRGRTVDGRIKEAKRQHKQTRLRKDAGQRVVLVSYDSHA